MATNDRKSAEEEVARRIKSIYDRSDCPSTWVEMYRELAESLVIEKQALEERASVLERALREIMVEVERFEDSEVVVILSPEVRQLARRAEGMGRRCG